MVSVNHDPYVTHVLVAHEKRNDPVRTWLCEEGSTVFMRFRSYRQTSETKAIAFFQGQLAVFKESLIFVASRKWVMPPETTFIDRLPLNAFNVGLRSPVDAPPIIQVFVRV